LTRIIAEISSGVWKNMSGDQGNERTMKAHKIAFFAAIFNMHSGFATLIGNFERPTTTKVNKTETDKTKKNPPVFNVTLQVWLFDLTTDETLSVKDCVGRVRVERIFGRVTDPGLWVSTRWKVGKKKGGTYSRSSSVNDTHEGVILWP
jgi:hypothetical protein